ncbi:hypothetical protein SERLA73DRAFT_189361 [Serpula lacrymans var. lacrymans S7.3]|uniref:Cytochrome P450 n=2 Tax=Serpula lacrymans var. lacrymans TaxID=341189 RepID=F8QDG3_SERL3|nr:uncharacterized protein SERLADRAFT_480139 [Serpula lacrymans var. lacrymans S7.9]EGN93634.1 hypothetical protein SERLA73DRAFT_189361 [Serpula lacrymans var. lacrymans S7.3]EGO19010.1 hypothetical protein SERLADRAFT_480139 [Serpula lacrymans var. lacrymans S7.9]
MENMSLVTYGLASSAFLAVAISKYLNRPNVDAIPTIGPSGILSSYLGAWRFLFHAHDMIQEGYTQYKGMAFKVPNIDNWHVIISGPKLIEELRKAPDNELSFLEATNESLKVEYTLGHEVHHNPYHVSVIRSQLTRNLAARFSDIRDEIAVSFDDIIKPKGDEWVSVPGLNTIMQVVCRTSNRLFVGLPLCRDPDWMDLNIKFTLDVVKGGMIINLFPAFMAPLVAKFLTSVPGSIRRAIKHLQPIIEERRRYIEEYGDDWAEKPKDMLSWLMDEAKGEEQTARLLTMRILTINFAAIHTSSMSFTHALFYLAAYPQYIQPLREEVEAIIEQEGWSKNALVKMRKVDSFLKEAQRFDGLGCISMSRKALKDFTFSDGTFIPAGCIVSVAAYPIHHDADIYADPHVFQPFRFADLREGEGEEVRHQMVSTNPEYIPFGHGRHACPGRFFAANELKAMLAHVVMTYDVKLEDEGVRPVNFIFNTASSPNPTAKVLFRKRAL